MYICIIWYRMILYILYYRYVNNNKNIYIYNYVIIYAVCERTNEPLASLAPNPQPQARNFGDQHQCTAEGIAFTTTPRG